MPFITVRSGGLDIPDGVYPVVLTEIRGPKTVTAQRGPKAGQDIELLDWIFAIDEGEYENTEVETSTSTASGPKSKMYGFLTALFGGRAPAVGTNFEVSDLVGRRALATIRKDSEGWCRIDNLGAMPASMLGQRVAAATGVPANAAPLNLAPAQRPARAAVAVADGTDDLPF